MAIQETVRSEDVAQVVHKYIQLDRQGARLSSHSYLQILQLMKTPLEKEEPGWDTSYIMGSYKVVNTEVKENHAIVKVEYYMIAKWQGEDLDLVPFSDTVEFKLEKIGGDWKVSEYIDYPRISLSTAIKQAEELNECIIQSNTDPYKYGNKKIIEKLKSMSQSKAK